MKKILLIVACCCAMAAQAQNRDIFICSTPEACITAVDSLLSSSKRTYILREAYPYNNRYIMEYKGAVPGISDSVNMRVVFKKVMRGANPDLEIEGMAEYSLYSIYGKFLDIFPVWKGYIDPVADMEVISEFGSSERKKFPNPDGSGEEYWMRRSEQDKTMWEFYRSFWTKIIRL